MPANNLTRNIPDNNDREDFDNPEQFYGDEAANDNAFQSNEDENETMPARERQPQNEPDVGNSEDFFGQKPANDNTRANEYQPPSLVENRPHEIGEEAQIEAANEMNAQKAQTSTDAEGRPRQNQASAASPAEESEELDEEAQEEAAMQLSAAQQSQIGNLEKQKAAAQEDLNRLESSLNDLKNTRVFKLTQIFSGGPTILIDQLMEFVKKDMRKMSAPAREKALVTAVALANRLLSVLKWMRYLAALMDAVFVDKLSVGKLIALAWPIIFIAPFWIMIMFIIFTLGIMPGVKGTLTPKVNQTMQAIEKQRDAWQKEIDTIAPKKAIRRQISQIEAQIEGIRAGKA